MAERTREFFEPGESRRLSRNVYVYGFEFAVPVYVPLAHDSKMASLGTV